MKYNFFIITLFLSVIILSCKDQKAEIDIPEPEKSAYAQDSLVLNKEEAEALSSKNSGSFLSTKT